LLLFCRIIEHPGAPLVNQPPNAAHAAQARPAAQSRCQGRIGAATLQRRRWTPTPLAAVAAKERALADPRTTWLEFGSEALAFVSLADEPPSLVYWGPRQNPLPDPADMARLAQRAVPHGGLDLGEPGDLFPEAGRGSMGFSALCACRGGVEIVTQSRLVDISCPSERAAAFHLEDAQAGVSVILSVEGHSSGVVRMSASVRNHFQEPLSVLWLAPAAIPLEGEEVATFSGRWAREFTPARTRLASGALVQENRTGRTSHHAPPFWVIGEPGFGEAHGVVLGLHLAWSGNHRGFAERLRDGALRFQAGERLQPGEVDLPQNGAYETPDLFLARSETGLGGLSDRLHPFVRAEILDGRTAKGPKVHLNTWEALYFNHTPDDLEALAVRAAALGVERFVLDDGWFKGRDTDAAGLGDWTPDPRKYPEGLQPLAARVRSLGMSFGVWVEPEMVSPAADLARARPDWILQAPGRVQPLGRGQMVLNLSNAAASDFVFSALDTLLRETGADYLKWDMNRDLVHAQADGAPMVRRQTRALYALIDRVRQRHPSVDIETCASGGGRVDYEILRRTDRIWASDCNDPFDRIAIQRALSIFLPPEILGSHVGPGEAHTTGRRTPLDLRAAVALFGSFGVETDVRRLNAADFDALKGWIERYKAVRTLLAAARTVRLETADPDLLCHMLVGEHTCLVLAVQTAAPRFSVPERLRLRELPKGVWTARRWDVPGPWGRRMKIAPSLALGAPMVLPSDVLSRAGLPMPVLSTGGFIVFQLERVG